MRALIELRPHAEDHGVTLVLPEPPDSLTGAPRAFYDELRRMLAMVRPGRLDAGAVAVKFDHEGVEVGMVHADRPEWVIEASVGKREAVVGTRWAHEHFNAPKRGVVEERPWTTEIVEFVAEILCGEIEVETTFRGGTPVVVRHFNRDDSGQRQLLGHTGFLIPGRLLVWRPKRTEIETPSFR